MPAGSDECPGRSSGSNDSVSLVHVPLVNFRILTIYETDG
jgi:hypothetical protein